MVPLVYLCVWRALYAKNKINDITDKQQAAKSKKKRMERIYRNDDVVEFLSIGIYCFFLPVNVRPA